MIDGLFKKLIDPLWERATPPLIRLGLTPNAVTLLGLLLVALSCAAFLWHRSTLIFGLTLAVAFSFDALDGAVARQRQLASKAGGYLDGMVDRYQELLVLGVVGIVSGALLLALLAFSGGVLTSYAKARTAIETPIDNAAWPDLFERLERVLFLCLLLIVDGAVALASGPRPWILPGGLALYAALAHVTAGQRIARALKLLRRADR